MILVRNLHYVHLFLVCKGTRLGESGQYLKMSKSAYTKRIVGQSLR